LRSAVREPFQTFSLAVSRPLFCPYFAYFYALSQPVRADLLAIFTVFRSSSFPPASFAPELRSGPPSSHPAPYLLWPFRLATARPVTFIFVFSRVTGLWLRGLSILWERRRRILRKRRVDFLHFTQAFLVRFFPVFQRFLHRTPRPVRPSLDGPKGDYFFSSPLLQARTSLSTLFSFPSQTSAAVSSPPGLIPLGPPRP